MGMDVPTVCAGLLHDTVEDTWATQNDIADTFGADIARLVEGVTKLSQFEINSKQKRQVESFRKLVLASLNDPRVIVVKLADRVHNMRTMDAMRDDKQKRIAEETLSIYAPIAHRLGIQWMSDELEDRSFAILEPEKYKEVLAKRDAMLQSRGESHEKIVQALSEVMAANEIPCTVSGRTKHAYSISRKMERDKVSFEELYDVFAFRVMVDDVGACYQALGIVHALWQPVQGRFKDYIAVPKQNGYRSLHTTVVGEEGTLLEIQIRTHEMHRFAEEGIAAHWAYKEDARESPQQMEFYRVMRQMLEATEGTDNNETFFETVREKLRAGHIFALTPKGDSIELPEGATVLDFAFKVHSDVGMRCSGALVNGRWVPIRQKLKTADVVSIQTKAGTFPTRDWLGIAVTASARSKIRAYLKQSESDEAGKQGKALLDRLVRNELGAGRKIETAEVHELAKMLGMASADKMLEALGNGRMHPTSVREKLHALESQRNPSWRETLQKSISKVFSRASDQPDIVVAGESGYLMKMAKCCRPIDGDEIVGFITRGRGITIHRAECETVAHSDPTRLLSASWTPASGAGAPRHAVRLKVLMTDSPGSLAAVSQAIAKVGANITQTNVTTTAEGGEGHFTVMVRDRAHLDRAVTALRKLKLVRSVERVD